MVPELVRLLDADPDLGADLAAADRAIARRALVAEVVRASGGDLRDVLPAERRDRTLGLLLLEGLVLRRVELIARVGVEIVGPGDFVRPWEPHNDLASVPASVGWNVVEPLRFAVIDQDVSAGLLHFPPLLQNLVTRLSHRADTLALNLALARLPRVDSRLLVLFWHLADRFGRVDESGVVVPLCLSHETLAELVFAQRQSVTRSLHVLAARGMVERRRSGTWVLHGEPPTTPESLGVTVAAASG